jgi:ABC-type glycerol-3-phosphate transport system substrate-binding protein
MKQKWIYAVILIAVLLFACAGETPAEQEHLLVENDADILTETSEEENLPVHVLLDDLPDNLDFGGADVTILSRSHIRSNDDIAVEELNGEIVNDAVFQRQRLVEDRLNVRINNVPDDGASHGADGLIRRLVTAGDHVYDIFTASSYVSAPLGLSGIFHNLYDIEHIDLSKPYWMQGYIENARISDTLFTISGDILLSVVRSAFAVFFNHELVEAYDLENPYQIVRDGRWTIDKKFEMVKDIYRDLNGDGEKDMEDFYGLGTSNVIIIDAYTSSFDLRNILFDENNLPFINTDVSKFAAATEKLHDLNWNQQGVFAYIEINDNNEMTDLCRYFAQGNLVFINNWLRGTETIYLRDMQADYGIIPYPKYDEHQQNYYTFLHDQFGAIGIPATAQNTEMIGAVLEALASESRRSVVPAYYDIALKGKYTRDVESAEMLDIIHNGVKLCMSWIYGSQMMGFPQIMRDLLLAGRSDYTTAFERNEARYIRVIDRMIEQIMNS